MALNIKRVEFATVSVGIPNKPNHFLAVRGLACSRLIAVDMNYGLNVAANNPAFPPWEGAYSIGVHFNDFLSEVFLGDKHFSYPTRRGQTHFLYVSDPAHVEFGSARHTQEIILQRSFMREVADDLEVSHVTELGRGLYYLTDDPVLRRLALRIHPHFDAPQTMNPLLADHFMWALCIYLCANYGGMVVRRPLTGGLATWQTRLAQDVIESRLETGIGLAELASICGLRISQFSHGFKRSTGVAPYEWLQHRRVDLAKTMLRRGQRMSVVATTCGFTDQSHFNRVFRRVVGVSPGVWKDSLN
ncbi:MAG: AraC family transcriptional regulator [Hyphomonadaceae bacterium]